jgi:hypothetical protein
VKGLGIRHSSVPKYVSHTGKNEDWQVLPGSNEQLDSLDVSFQYS